MGAFGQDVEQSERSTGGFNPLLIGINFSPDYSFRSLKSFDGSSDVGFVIQSRDGIEIAKLGYTTGINLCYNLSPKLGVETGLQYSNKGYQTKKNNLSYIDPETGQYLQAKWIYKDAYLDVPLKLNITFGKRNLRFISSIGFVTNIFLSQHLITFVDKPDGKTERIVSEYELRRINISPMVSLGIDYKINYKMNIRVEPTFRYGVIKILDSPIKEYLWNAGLNIGYYVALN
jgi:hypothetical protein